MEKIDRQVGVEVMGDIVLSFATWYKYFDTISRIRNQQRYKNWMCMKTSSTFHSLYTVI